jgi:gliding motility-associated transport system ATP-binding protein
MIHVEHIEKRFGEICAIDGISFDIARGEVVGLLGPNGAGKTTTMRIITGYLAPNAGSVTVDGIHVSENSIESRRRIGYLPENAPLYDDMEVTEYLDYTAKLRAMEKVERATAISEMVETCGLRGVAGRAIGVLSKGYRQRVGLAAAMIHHPPILILDEPTSGLDPNQISEIRDLIREIGKKRTVVLSTHILQEVEATCSRAIIMNAGKLVGEGTIAELIGSRGKDSSYSLCARATKKNISAALEKLDGLDVTEWFSDEGSELQRFTLSGDRADGRGEDIFQWAVSSGIVLSELAHESASLEDVFRELTKK